MSCSEQTGIHYSPFSFCMTSLLLYIHLGEYQAPLSIIHGKYLSSYVLDSAHLLFATCTSTPELSNYLVPFSQKPNNIKASSNNLLYYVSHQQKEVSHFILFIIFSLFCFLLLHYFIHPEMAKGLS